MLKLKVYTPKIYKDYPNKSGEGPYLSKKEN